MMYYLSDRKIEEKSHRHILLKVKTVTDFPIFKRFQCYWAPWWERTTRPPLHNSLAQDPSPTLSWLDNKYSFYTGFLHRYHHLTETDEKVIFSKQVSGRKREIIGLWVSSEMSSVCHLFAIKLPHHLLISCTNPVGTLIIPITPFTVTLCTSKNLTKNLDSSII